MKRDDTDQSEVIPAGTVEEAKKRAALAVARAHRAKARLKQAKKTYKELKKAAKKARKEVERLKERAGKGKTKTARKSSAKPKAGHNNSGGTKKQVRSRPVAA